MLTAERLRAIAERDRRDREYIERQRAAPAAPNTPAELALEEELGPLPDIRSVRLRPGEEERGELLDLLRAVARHVDADEVEGEHYCLFCRAQVFGPPDARLSLAQDHAADCPAPVLDALREP